jgi:hypothetical protein
LPARLVFLPCERQPRPISKFYDLSGKYCQTLPVSLGWLSQGEKTRGAAGLVWCQTLQTTCLDFKVWQFVQNSAQTLNSSDDIHPQ